MDLWTLSSNVPATAQTQLYVAIDKLAANLLESRSFVIAGQGSDARSML